MNVLSKLEDYLEECKDAEKKKRVLDFYFAVRSFLNIHDIMDENYVIFSEMMEDGRFQIKLFCVNPAVNLQNYLEQGNSTIFFSATLLPVHYYKKPVSYTHLDVYKRQVLEALEGTFSIIDRIPGEEQDAVQEAIEKLVWSRIDETVNTFLEQKTLKMLTDEYREKLEQNAGMYYI